MNRSLELKNVRMQADVIFAGTSAILEIGTIGMSTILATIPLANPIGNVVDGVLTLTTPIYDNLADASGIATVARVRKSVGGVDVYTNISVGSEGTELILSTTDFILGVTVVNIKSATITHSA